MNLLKYPGGKERELKYILPNLPKFKNYYEPFVGGGSVFLNISAKKYYINDNSKDLINLFTAIKKEDKDFFYMLEQIDKIWNKITIFSNNRFTQLYTIYLTFISTQISNDELKYLVQQFIAKEKEQLDIFIDSIVPFQPYIFYIELEKQIVKKFIYLKTAINPNNNADLNNYKEIFESIFKSSFYIYIRNIINNDEKIPLSNGIKAAFYLFIRELCYSSMFRYNKQGKFNVPYGGISYNNKSFANKIKHYQSETIKNKFAHTEIHDDDFSIFLDKCNIEADDFIFVDPPYDTDFSSYNNNHFINEDHKRLSDYLINQCKGYFMLIIKNTDFISTLYIPNTKCANKHSLIIKSFQKQYQVSFKNRNNKKAEHLIITNY